MNSVAFKFNYDDYAIEMGTGNIFQTILEDYETLGVIGEEHNKLMCYLAATSRLMDNPLNILVLSSSGAGKSTLQDKTLKLMPPESVIRASTITDKALFYMKSLKNKLLALEEAAGVKDTYTIRTLISEGYLAQETVSGGQGQPRNKVPLLHSRRRRIPRTDPQDIGDAAQIPHSRRIERPVR